MRLSPRIGTITSSAVVVPVLSMAATTTCGAASRAAIVLPNFQLPEKQPIPPYRHLPSVMSKRIEDGHMFEFAFVPTDIFRLIDVRDHAGNSKVDSRDLYRARIGCVAQNIQKIELEHTGETFLVMWMDFVQDSQGRWINLHLRTSPVIDIKKEKDIVEIRTLNSVSSGTYPPGGLTAGGLMLGLSGACEPPETVTISLHSTIAISIFGEM